MLGLEDLKEAAEKEFAIIAEESDVTPGLNKHILMLNCGAAVNLSDIMPELPGDLLLHVIDSHRPFSPSNISHPKVVLPLFS